MDIRGWISEHPSTEFVASGVVVAGHIALSVRFKDADWLSWVSSEQRVSIYGTGAAVIALLGGLCSIAVSVILSGEGERAKAVRRHYGSVLRRNWRGLILATFAASLLCLVAQTLDGKDATGPTWGRWMFEYALVLAVLSLTRLVWLFDRLMAVFDQDLVDVPRGPAPGLRPRWRARDTDSGPQNHAAG
ncbi:MAG: hypothetical protein ACRDXB_00295 [Actinomycetes bacterium]